MSHDAFGVYANSNDQAQTAKLHNLIKVFIGPLLDCADYLYRTVISPTGIISGQ